MTANYGVPRPSELDEDELTAVLAAADDDLMSYVRTGADPAAALLAIMDDRLSRPSVRKKASDAAAVITMRSMAHVLAAHLDSDIEYANIIVGGIERADGRARMLITALSGGQIRDADLVNGLASSLYRDIARCADELAWNLSARSSVAVDLRDHAGLYVDELHAGTAEFAEVVARALDGVNDLSSILGGAYALANDLGFQIARYSGSALDTTAVLLDRARELADTFGNVRIRIRATIDDLHLAAVLNPARELAWIEVDASGVDLSRTLFNDPDVLIGVIWTWDTTWPDGVVDEVRARSEEVCSGVYQVRGPGLDIKDLVKV